MKKHILFPIFTFIYINVALFTLKAQDTLIYPSFTGTGVFMGATIPLRDIPPLSEAEMAAMFKERSIIHPDVQHEDYKPAPQENEFFRDPVWQSEMGTESGLKAPIVTITGPATGSNPPDPCVAAGPNHVMIAINWVYSIYNKSGVIQSGPSSLKSLFNTDWYIFDPVLLYDDLAGRWVIAAVASGTNNYYLIFAVSQTNNPTGSWNVYSFDVDDMPDAPKLGVWPDGYYVGVNNSGTGKKDVFVFQRSVMLDGGTNPQMIGFDNSWRPSGLYYLVPADNDGTSAPVGSPGIFVGFNDGAVHGGTDQLWIFTLTANWSTPTSSTFTRAQTQSVTAFDSQFSGGVDNISQKGTTMKLWAHNKIMNWPVQYRNFGCYQTLVCSHTVRVNTSTNQAGTRWYELRKYGTGSWEVRQTGTYAPGSDSRWVGSARLNGKMELGLGYSISGSDTYPGIRYCGQDAIAYGSATGTMNVSESVIVDGTLSQTSTNRWGDYTCIAVDPADDKTFWYVNHYETTNQNAVTAASFKVAAEPALKADLIFSALSTYPSTIKKGSTTNVSVKVKNQGNAASPVCYVRIFLSSDLVYDYNDTYLNQVGILTLNPGAQYNTSKVITIPSNTPVGQRYLIFLLDAYGVVYESDEANNKGVVPVIITATKEDETGFEEIALPLISVHPNPSSQYIIIGSDSGFENITQFEIYNVSGLMVKSFEVAEQLTNTVKIVHGLNPGFYFLLARGKNTAAPVKFIVK